MGIPGESSFLCDRFGLVGAKIKPYYDAFEN
jgi:hypothetical protein